MSPAVLFVDDERAVLRGLERNLAREPYETLTAPSAEEGLRILGGRAVDVVVSDGRMPGMCGRDFLIRVRDRYPAVVRIMLTGDADLTSAVRTINAGQVYRLLTKPVHVDDLKRTIRQALRMKCLAAESARLSLAAAR